MNSKFNTYRERSFAFIKTLTVDGVVIKLYTISFRDTFAADKTLMAVQKEVINWQRLIETSNLSTHKNAFLIVHEAQEGMIILFNWWTGENMIETKLFFASHDTPDKIKASIFKSKQLVCIWELEILYHERSAWIRHVLSKPNNPDYLAYQTDIYQKAYERIS